MNTWTEHVNRWKDCDLCPLSAQRCNIVLARAGVVGGANKGGGLPADVCFIGEAPGASEDASGLPFWGPAGDLLQKIIDRALPVGTTYTMSNLVACFPAEAKARGDNEPELAEIKACRPRLTEFIEIANPKLICCVGSLATEYVEWDRSRGRCDIVHPAFILRGPSGGGMPLAQKHMAIQKCIVTIRNAFEEIMV